jgi:hypothetical protein
MMRKQDWILSILGDLERFARENEMPELAESLVAAGHVCEARIEQNVLKTEDVRLDAITVT